MADDSIWYGNSLLHKVQRTNAYGKRSQQWDIYLLYPYPSRNTQELSWKRRQKNSRSQSSERIKAKQCLLDTIGHRKPSTGEMRFCHFLSHCLLCSLDSHLFTFLRVEKREYAWGGCGEDLRGVGGGENMIKCIV